MPVLRSALTVSVIAASLAVIAATAADAQSRYRYGPQATNEWPVYSSPAPFSREAVENFTQP